MKVVKGILIGLLVIVEAVSLHYTYKGIKKDIEDNRTKIEITQKPNGEPQTDVQKWLVA